MREAKYYEIEYSSDGKRRYLWCLASEVDSALQDLVDAKIHSRSNWIETITRSLPEDFSDGEALDIITSLLDDGRALV